MIDQSITIRNARTEDVEMLARIIRESFRDVAVRFSLTRKNCPKHPSNCTASWIESDKTRGVQYFILSIDDVPIGCAGLESPSSDLCYLERLSVLPEMRRQGFGKALIRHTLECAKAKGARQVSIGIIAKHTELKHWYMGIGFVEVQTKSFQHLPFQVSFLKFKIGDAANQ